MNNPMGTRFTIFDDEVAQVYMEEHKGTAFGLGDFRRYSDGCWSVVDNDQVSNEILTIMRKLKQLGVKPTKNRLASIREILRLMIHKGNDVWDSNPDIIVCKNGAIDLTTGSLRDFSPEDFATSRIGVEFDQEATAPTWELVLSTFPDDVRCFLQEFAGLALTTDTRYEIAVCLYGPPGGGKSTILDGVTKIVEPKATVLSLTQLQRSNFALADLVGKTLVTSSELPSGRIPFVDILNAIISGEPIEIDRKYRDKIVVRLVPKLLWATNEKPDLMVGGGGLSRRIVLIPVPAVAVQARDPEVKRRIVEEAPGILIWALEGLKRLRERGRFVLPATASAPEDFHEEFIKKHFKLAENGRVSSADLYAIYKQHCLASDRVPESRIAVAKHWKRLGIRNVKIRGRRYWKGISPIADHPCL